MTEVDHTLAAAYALNALEPSERENFEQHLAMCDACTTDAREMTATTARFALAEVAEPPTAMRRHVLALVQQTPQLSSDPTVVPLRRPGVARPMNRWLAGVAAAVVLAVGALGVTTYQANQRAERVQASADQVNAILTDPNTVLTRAEVTGGGTGTFVVSREQQQGVFVSNGVSNLDADQTYQLWAINDDGAESLGLYSTASGGDGTELVDFPDSATTFGMTVEPAGGSAQPSTEPVLLLPLDA